jgi:hypothetical protein
MSSKRVPDGLRRSTGTALLSATGSALGSVFGAVAALRRARALHPRGTVLAATMHRLPHPPTGIAWLDGTDDEPDGQRVTVRLSRSAGLPAPLPDVLGLAVIVPLPAGRRGDLLLSTAGRAPLLRHFLLPRRDPLGSAYTCLVPYASDRGLVMVAALPDGGKQLRLAYARPRGAWQRFARLVLEVPAGGDTSTSTDGAGAADRDDPALELDPVLHPLPGLRVPRALARLREPAYARSRRARHGVGDLRDARSGTAPAPSLHPDATVGPHDPSNA